MCRGNVGRMDAQNRNGQNGSNRRQGILVQVLSHRPSRTGFYSPGMRNLQMKRTRSNVYGQNRNEEAGEEKSATGSYESGVRIDIIRHFEKPNYKITISQVPLSLFNFRSFRNLAKLASEQTTPYQTPATAIPLLAPPAVRPDHAA